MSVSRRNRILLAVAAVAALGSGCALMEVGQTLYTNKPVELNNPRYAGRGLPPIPQPKNVLKLDITFVERPAGDPLLAKELWTEIDQLSAVAPEVRATLEQNGLRTGIASATPSRAMQALLGLSTSIPDERTRIAHQTAPVESGGSTRIPCSIEPYDHCTLRLVGDDGPQAKEFDNARCLLTVTAHRLQEGWVQLEFQPEIHHDDRRLRYTPTESRRGPQWGLRETQQVETLFGQRFSLKLNMGERAVLTAGDGDDPSVGRLFFIGNGPDAKTQRVLVIRVADMTTAQAVRRQTFGNW